MFDGVRSYPVKCIREWEPAVELKYLRNLIDILEKSDEEEPYAHIKALILANENWVETNILNMWRYGMENSVAFSHNVKKDDNTIIDVEAEGELDGSPEITKKINS